MPGVALITGAASGIGRTTAIAFAQAGCSLFALLDMNEAGLEATKTLLIEVIGAISSHQNYTITTHVVDIRLSESVISTYAAVKSQFSRIDYAVHCAGVGVTRVDAPTADCSIEQFDLKNAINYRGTFLCSRETIRIMLEQSLDCEAYPDAGIPTARAQRGAIVNISSVLGWISSPSSTAYCASKAAVLGMTRSDAVDYASNRIRVNAVLPGIVDTPMTTSDQKMKASVETNAVRVTPLKRFGQPEELADVCVFLSGNKASFVTGVAWAVDGGASACVGYI